MEKNIPCIEITVSSKDSIVRFKNVLSEKSLYIILWSAQLAPYLNATMYLLLCSASKAKVDTPFRRKFQRLRETIINEINLQNENI